MSSVFFKYSTDLSFRIVEFLPLLTVVCLIEIIDRFHWYLRCRYVFRFEWVFNDLHFYEKDAKKSKIQCLSLLLASLYQVKYFDSWVTLTWMEKKKINITFSLWFRMSTPVIITLVSAIVLVPRIGSGPLMDWMNSIFIDGCQQSWWSVILYVQNLVDPSNFVSKRNFRIFKINEWLRLMELILSLLILVPVTFLV